MRRPAPCRRVSGCSAVALATDDDSVWAVWRERGSLYRIDPDANEVAGTVELFRDTPCIWAAAGAVWAGYGGTSDIVADGETLLVICHRDSTLWRLDPATNTAEPLSELPGDTPERLALAAGSLWATAGHRPSPGRPRHRRDAGDDRDRRWRHRPRSGRWDGVGRGRGAGGRPAGVPELESLVPVKAETGEAGESLTPSEPVDVNGLAANGAEVWIADVAGGTLVRVR